MTAGASGSAHALLAPSSAHIWAADGGCRGSVEMQSKFPEDAESEEAREGTAAHFYPTELLQGRDVPPGAVAPNGVPINAEMIDAAQALLIDVRDTMRAFPGGQLYVEQRFASDIIHAQNWGTPDVVYVVRDEYGRWRVYIWDYKYGHRYVDVTGNLQVINYAALVLAFLHPDPADWTGIRVSLTIAQPRNYHPSGPMREWYISGEGVRDRLDKMRKAAWEATQPGAAFTSGDHCRDCTGRHACPALQAAGALAMDVSMRSNPVVMPPHAVGLELRQIEDAIDRLKARQTGLEEQALGMIRGGTLVPFYTTEYASGRETFTAPLPEVFALGDMLGVDFRKEPAAITPGQARAALKKQGIDGGVISSYANKPRGALRLTRVNDDAAKLAFEQE